MVGEVVGEQGVALRQSRHQSARSNNTSQLHRLFCGYTPTCLIFRAARTFLNVFMNAFLVITARCVDVMQIDVISCFGNS